ncbi:MAG: hypothetical protein SFY66_04385 [Oculatellaceae cyanobacterium bins.114]|nr:hypothetical protein [Oculatellaceae cyanobacterium bins.114]
MGRRPVSSVSLSLIAARSRARRRRMSDRLCWLRASPRIKSDLLSRPQATHHRTTRQQGNDTPTTENPAEVAT